MTSRHVKGGKRKLKEYISPEFELVKFTVINSICMASDPTDPVEGNGEEHNFDDGWD